MSQKSKKILGLLMLVASITLLISFPHGADAARLFPKIVPNCDQEAVVVNGIPNIPLGQRCGLNDLVQLFINLFDWGFAILSILSIVFFIIGGTYMLISGGNEQRVQTGKSILVNTTLGIGIALGSWLIINTVIGLLVGNGTFNNVQVFGKNWWGVNSCTSEYSKACAQYDLREGCGDTRTSYVSELQRKLRDAGCGNIQADGCFGPQTTLALQTFNTAQKIQPETVASHDTWRLLNDNQKCGGASSTTTIASGDGCCATQCGTGIANTTESNGTNGCKDLFPGDQSVWYTDDNNPGACSDQATASPSGCCEFPGDNTCVNAANQDWCTQTKRKNVAGSYVDGKCESTYCSAGITQCK